MSRAGLLLGFLEIVVVGPFLGGGKPGVDVLDCEAGLPGVGDGVQFLGLDYGIYFLCGLISGGQVLSLPLRFPLVHGVDDGVQVCGVVGDDQVNGLPRSRGPSPWIACVSFDSWRAWTLTEVREVKGPICRCPGISVSCIDRFANEMGVPAVGDWVVSGGC